MRTHSITSYNRRSKDIRIMPPELALELTHLSSNYPCLVHIFKVPKVFEPLKFYCIYKQNIKILMRYNLVSGEICKNLGQALKLV